MTTLQDQIEQARAAVAEEIERFLDRHDMAASRFGRLAMGDPTFVYELRRGRRLEPETIDALRLFMTCAKRRSGRTPGNAGVAA